MVHDSAIAWTMRGDEYILPEEADEALTCYIKAILIDPYYPPAWNRIGRVCMVTGHRKEAELCFWNEAASLKRLDLQAMTGAE